MIASPPPWSAPAQGTGEDQDEADAEILERRRRREVLGREVEHVEHRPVAGHHLGGAVADRGDVIGGEAVVVREGGQLGALLELLAAGELDLVLHLVLTDGPLALDVPREIGGDAVARGRQSAIVYLTEPTLIGSTIVEGPVLFTHDNTKMARGLSLMRVSVYPERVPAR